MAAARERIENKTKAAAKASEAVNNAEQTGTAAGGGEEQQATKAKLKSNSKKSNDSASKIDDSNTNKENNPTEDPIETIQCNLYRYRVFDLDKGRKIINDLFLFLGNNKKAPSQQQESMKEEDYMLNIASKLIQIIVDSSQDQLDLDVMVDVTLILWKKCKDLFQKYQTGAHDNYKWVAKLDNLPKVYINNHY